MSLTPEYFVGTWSEQHVKRKFTLSSDGSSISFLGDTERYPGTWRFKAPNKLVVRAVIPLNIPGVDDEVNAEEMVFTIDQFSDGSFTASEFDYEKESTFVRTNG